MENLETTEVFFEALKYPEFARPNFYIEKAKESGWSMSVYITALLEAYHRSMIILTMAYHSKKRTYKDLKIDDVKLPLNRFYKSELTIQIDKKTIENLHLAVHSMEEFNREKKNYSPYEILSFVEHALAFTLREFKLLIGQDENSGFRPNQHVFSCYLISQDGPFFDFPIFKATILNLLATAENPEFIRNYLRKFSRCAIDIISLWNNEIFELEKKMDNKDNKEPGRQDMIRVEFHVKSLSHSWWSSPELFDIKPHHLYTIQNLALYASQIANFIEGDIQNGSVDNLKTKRFIDDFIEGVINLTELGKTTMCNKNIFEKKNLEAPFRDWLFTWFEARYYHLQREALIENKRIDLKVSHASIWRKIIEFKGWWERSRKQVIQQTLSYLTDFEGDGYIFMINHKKKSINDEYKAIVTDVKTAYEVDSWMEFSFKTSAYRYYKTTHLKNGIPKDIYHLIYTVPD